ncbi:MAG: hypothetical protein VBE63_12730 [Lamprobacter sp.]|uniref:hypothetical protein n=1 Tax=Lamprobacter sp. TaxID=3100796 RepID=UPI002B25673F|nr:hypothetical protein [Lamprobacter sp.]MEA3640793.1 hypothetical protein [Lamprobacter sp.]
MSIWLEQHHSTHEPGPVPLHALLLLAYLVPVVLLAKKQRRCLWPCSGCRTTGVPVSTEIMTLVSTSQ